ncbi:hypothetical protein VNO78_03688 [Psophocarpus tetragonolobus]|uniref:Uncharacterized protein n=1 Tax=Psophocarpus tetragonolobus TaxID=3891 RepID=A0AAN9T1Y1_PSOTE
MAYYSSAYYGSDYGEYNFNSYALNYDSADQTPPFMAYNGYEYNQSYYGHDSSLYYAPNFPVETYQNISYSATTFSDPKSLVYDPNYGMTQLVISCSNVEFNVPEFDEYDSTPYGGGYDIDQTYGKALPPSDKICYPRSGSSPSTEPFSGSIVPLHTIEEGIEEKAITPPSVQKPTEEKPQSQDGGKDQPREVEHNNSDTGDLKPNEDEDSESEESQQEVDHYSESDIGSGFGEGYNGGQGYEHEKKVVPQYPSGYGLEAMDICEGLFGYWPCLERMKRRECHREEVNYRGNNCQDSIWQGTADYLFGSPYPYGGRGEDGGGDVIYGYQRHFPMQPQYRQIDYNGESC